MPNVLVHTLFAEKTLDRWRGASGGPFDVRDGANRAAFVHGALGPDLGYFPGADPLLSELTHRLRTGRMAERLLAEARTEVEIAFACGWVTHLLADIRLHPIVETEAARAAHAETSRPAGIWNGARSAIDLAHVRVEVGLDGAFLARLPAIGRRLPAVLDLEGARFIARAFGDVYGDIADVEEFHAAHYAVSHWHRCLVPLIRWMTADWSADGSGAARMVAPLLRSRDGTWVRYVGAGPVAAAFVSPIRPAPDLVDRFDFELDALSGAVDAAIAQPFLLSDRDMEDGRLICEQKPKPGTARTMEALESRLREREGRIATSVTPAAA